MSPSDSFGSFSGLSSPTASEYCVYLHLCACAHICIYTYLCICMYCIAGRLGGRGGGEFGYM